MSDPAPRAVRRMLHGPAIVPVSLVRLAVALGVCAFPACTDSSFEYADEPDASAGGSGTGGSAGLGGAGGASGAATGGSAGASLGGSGGASGAAGASASYAAAVIASSPAAYWRFEETGGDTVADTVSSGITGTLASGDGGTVAKLGEAGAFPGTHAIKLGGAGAVLFGDHFDFAAGAPFTLEALVKLYTYPQSGYSNLLTKYGAGDGWRTELNSAKGIGVILYVAANPTPHYASSLKVVESEWTYVAFTFSGNQLCNYLGNPPDTLQSLCKDVNKSLPSTGTQLKLGGGLNGWADEVAIYNKALTQTDLGAHYKAAVANGMP